MKEGLVLLLVMVMLSPAVAAGFSKLGQKTSKNRLMLKALLYDMTHSRVQTGKMAEERQCGGSSGVVCCDIGTTVIADGFSKCATRAKYALLLKVNQLDNYDRRFIRLNKAIKLIENKRAKNGDFRNTSDHLLRALGGDIKSPRCSGGAGQNKQADTMRDAVSTLVELNSCTDMINQTCFLNETERGIKMNFFEECDQLREEFNTKTDGCTEIDDTNIVAKCFCWETAENLAEDLKKKEEVFLNGSNWNCYKAIKEASISTASGPGLKGTCLKEFTKCKQAEDRAIALINACGDEDTLVIGSFRSMLNDEEDNEDYDDYDYPGEWDWLHDYDM